MSQLEYLREKSKIESQPSLLGARQEREVLDAGTYLENLAAVWEGATLPERREMVLALLVQVVCDPETKRVIALQPKQVFVPPFRQVPNLKEQEGVFEVVS